ncbi:hypothetical protein ACVWZK_006397 [Bradyrhizobium sp. GM0.4]
MSSDQIGGLVRTLLGILGGFILAKGWVNAETWAWIVGGAAAAIPAIWSWVSNRPAAIAASAQSLPGVNVVTSPSAAPAVQAAVAAAK